VFIADNIKEIIPEYLMLLKGVIDCPDLPLNVSRSALQNDGFVNKVAEYISKKVADKLTGMCNTDLENYEKYWDDISPFVKFGCLKDQKFCDKMMDSILFKNLDHKYLSMKELIGEVPEEAKTEDGGNKEEAKETEKKTIYYVTDEQQQSQYINLFKSQGMDAVILSHNIDAPFITQLEQRNQHIHFQRIDADVTDQVKEEVGEEEKEAFGKRAEEIASIVKKAMNNENLQVKVEKIKDENIASMMTLSEESRRMQEMMKMYGMGGMDASMFGSDTTLVLNINHPLVQYIENNKDSENINIICQQLYDLAMLSNKPLSPEQMTDFIKRSNDIMLMLTN
jgi:molecular chaperone HtpG